MGGSRLRFAVSLQNDRPIAETVEGARLAESLGYPEIWTNENGHYRGIFTVASTIAANTATARIGLGIVNPFHRHPSVIAMEAAALDEASGGRLKLGIGAAQWNLRNLGEADERTRRPYTSTVEGNPNNGARGGGGAGAGQRAVPRVDAGAPGLRAAPAGPAGVRGSRQR